MAVNYFLLTSPDHNHREWVSAYIKEISSAVFRFDRGGVVETAVNDSFVWIADPVGILYGGKVTTQTSKPPKQALFSFHFMFLSAEVKILSEITIKSLIWSHEVNTNKMAFCFE